MPIRILVVDDNRDTLRAYIKALSRGIKPKEWNSNLSNGLDKPPVEVDEADTVSVALKKLREQFFDMLVVDLKIPGLSSRVAAVCMLYQIECFVLIYTPAQIKMTKMTTPLYSCQFI